MLNETCPSTNLQKQVSKREKEVGVGKHAHTHPHLLQIHPRSEGPKEYYNKLTYKLINYYKQLTS